MSKEEKPKTKRAGKNGVPTPARALDYELAATVLLEAAFTTDEKAAEKYDVDARTVRRWRGRLASDPILAGVMASKKADVDLLIADDLTTSIRKAIKLVGSSCEAIEADPLIKKSPDVIHSVSGAIKILGEFHIVNRMLNARLSRISQSMGSNTGQESATGRTGADEQPVM